MPNEEIREQNMEKVLAAAYESFLTKGIENTTQAMIAQTTGLSLRTVNRYFANKDMMIVLVAKYALDMVKSGETVSASKLRLMGKSGIELLELYFTHVKAGYLKNPNVYMLRVELGIYFSRNKLCENKIYDGVVTEINSRPMLREIFRLGTEDGTIKLTADVDTEERLLCNNYLSFISALIVKKTSQRETDASQEIQLNLFFERLLDQYRA